MHYLKIRLFTLTTLIVAQCSAADQINSDRSDFKRTLTRDCGIAYTTTCLKLDLVSWIDKLNEDENYALLPGVSMVKENGSRQSNTADIVAELARDFPNDPDARLDAFLIKKVESYVSSHSIKLDLWSQLNGGLLEEGRGRGGGGLGGGGGGGGGKGGGGMIAVLAAAAMMKGTLLALTLGGIAAIAGKAIMTALISLLLSGIIGLKALTHQKKTTYEIVSKPVYTHSSVHSEDHGYSGHSGMGRSMMEVPLPLGLHPDYTPEAR